MVRCRCPVGAGIAQSVQFIFSNLWILSVGPILGNIVQRDGGYMLVATRKEFCVTERKTSDLKQALVGLNSLPRQTSTGACGGPGAVPRYTSKKCPLGCQSEWVHRSTRSSHSGARMGMCVAAFFGPKKVHRSVTTNILLQGMFVRCDTTIHRNYPILTDIVFL